MPETNRSRLDALLDLLADEVAERLKARSDPRRAETEPAREQPTARTQVPAAIVAPEPSLEPAAESAPSIEPSLPSHAASLMARLATGILLVLVLINIPFNAQGTAIARSIPSSASLVIANGLLVREEPSPDVYVYRDGQFHWITSLDAFQYFGYQWENVHAVESGFLNDFAKGTPIYVLLKCDASPHIYRLEAGTKRWIVDIPTFQAEGHVWQDVKMVPCNYLRSLPDGDSVPPGRGTPPPPIP